MNHYQTTIAPGGHWSLELRRGTLLRLQDIDGNGNAGCCFITRATCSSATTRRTPSSVNTLSN